MARPVVLVAWEPTAPEEALAVQETLEPLARVEWIHELSPALARDLLPETVAVVAGTWPPGLTESLASMRSLRLVSCIPASPKGLPTKELLDRDVRVEAGDAPSPPSGPQDPRRHVERARAAAERVAAFLRQEPYVNAKPSGTDWPL